MLVAIVIAAVRQVLQTVYQLPAPNGYRNLGRSEQEWESDYEWIVELRDNISGQGKPDPSGEDEEYWTIITTIQSLLQWILVDASNAGSLEERSREIDLLRRAHESWLLGDNVFVWFDDGQSENQDRVELIVENLLDMLPQRLEILMHHGYEDSDFGDGG